MTDLYMLSVLTPIVLALIGGLIWLGKMAQKVNDICKVHGKCPINNVVSDVCILKSRVDDLWYIYLDDCKRSRPDLFKQCSPLKAVDEAKERIPDEVKQIINDAKDRNGGLYKDSYLYIRNRYPPKEMVDDAKRAGMSLKVYVAVLSDVAEEILGENNE